MALEVVTTPNRLSVWMGGKTIDDLMTFYNWEIKKQLALCTVFFSCYYTVLYEVTVSLTFRHPNQFILGSKWKNLGQIRRNSSKPLMRYKTGMGQMYGWTERQPKSIIHPAMVYCWSGKKKIINKEQKGCCFGQHLFLLGANKTITGKRSNCKYFSGPKVHCRNIWTNKLQESRHSLFVCEDVDYTVTQNIKMTKLI